MFYIVLLALIAGFLALRLYSILGKRTGHEQPLARAAEERVAPVAIPRPIEASPEPREIGNRAIDPRAEAGLRAIVAGEPGFDVTRFVEGAKSAYGMVLDAFWKGDEDTLRDLATDDVRDSFAAAIAARREAGEVLENRLVSVENATIIDAGVENRVGRIVVRFDADIAAVTRNAEGEVVAGSLTDAVQTHDIWTFTRPLKSADPNWKLADTDEA